MSEKKIIKIVAKTKDYLWGGNKLRNYGKVSDKDKIAESWELSYHKDGPSETENGELLSTVLTAEDLGKNVTDFQDFPVLVKLIDSDNSEYSTQRPQQTSHNIDAIYFPLIKLNQRILANDEILYMKLESKEILPELHLRNFHCGRGP